MTWRVEEAPGFLDTVVDYAGRYSPEELADRIETFVIWKKTGGPCPFSADKASGRIGGRVVFSAYRDAGFHHCHLDIKGTEPLLAYRLFLSERRIVLLCITDHKAMFEMPKRFYRLYRATRFGHPR